jgi:cell division septation protein DedD
VFSGVALGLAVCVALLPCRAWAQNDEKPEKHGRKYKAPPETAHIEVTVIKGFNKKPIPNAAVVFHPVKDGVDEGNLEVKTDPDGKAIIDVIPIGSQVRVQVIAGGFATYAEDFDITGASKEILVTMIRPQAQISAYVDTEGKPATIAPGVQEPVRPKKTTPATPAATAPAAAPAETPAPPPAPETKPQS